MLKKGFTLIELLAVIIILAIVALIATPIVLNVVDSAKDSAMRSQLSLYADSIKIQLTQGYLTNGGKYSSVINLEDDNLDKSVTCEEACYTKDSKVLLGNCTIKGYSGNHWYVNGKVSNEKPSDFDSLKTNVIACNGEIIKEYVDNSGANKPELYNKMIPVIYENNNWIYADTNKKWYDYDAKEWANAVVLNSGVTKNVGDIINVDTEVSLMFVWIPRYKYTIFNGNNGSINPQEINIVFERGTAKTGTVTCSDALNQTDSSGNLISEICTDSTNGNIINGISTYTHPAFTFGTQELTGIWVGKFENSTTDATCNTNQNAQSCNKVLPVTITPNVRSWVIADLSKHYTSISNISSKYEMNVDSHMMKNMEWGAVAYLSHSKYGRCDNGTCIEIAKNDSSDYYTGRSLGRPARGVGVEHSPSGTYTYELPLGQLASTTGNIYGIYDMSGGVGELVMGNMANSISNEFDAYYAGFSTPPPTKYYDLYTTSYYNMDYSRGKLGDATKETIQTYGDASGEWSSGWYIYLVELPHYSYGWFIRGGWYCNSTYDNTNIPTAGVFVFDRSYGDYDFYQSPMHAARAVVVSADDN